MIVIFELEKENLIPGFDVIMIGKRNIMIYEGFGRIRRQIPLIFMNEFANIKMMIKQFSLCIIMNGTNSNEIRMNEDIQIISLNFERMRWQEVPFTTEVFLSYDNRSFQMDETLFNIEQVHERLMMIG